MMRKKRLACVMAAVLALSLTACEKNKRADVWEDRQIIVDDVAYSLPMDFGTLEELGWKINTDRYDVDSYIEPGKTKELPGLYRDDYTGNVFLNVDVTNYGKDREKLRDCVIDDLWISDDSGKEDEMFIDIPKVVVANDITWGSTEDEVLEVFGKPDEIDETGVGPIIYIYIFPDENGDTELHFVFKNGVSGIRIIKNSNESSTISGEGTSPNDSSDHE